MKNEEAGTFKAFALLSVMATGSRYRNAEPDRVGQMDR